LSFKKEREKVGILFLKEDEDEGTPPNLDPKLHFLFQNPARH